MLQLAGCVTPVGMVLWLVVVPVVQEILQPGGAISPTL
jgi:hypothetical protein